MIDMRLIQSGSDVFLDPSIYNENILPESSKPSSHSICQFLDDTLRIKEVNIK